MGRVREKAAAWRAKRDVLIITKSTSMVPARELLQCSFCYVFYTRRVPVLLVHVIGERRDSL